MAPAKGFLFQRMMACDFLGINWGKVCWHTPYQNFYPVTVTAGQQGRLYSSPIWWGNKEHRMTRIVVRSLVYVAPSVVLGGLFFLQADWFTTMKIACFLTNQTVPDWASAQYADEMKWNTRNKPGVTLKHLQGGQVMIPGSEINIDM
jgi:hypothetical protein